MNYQTPKTPDLRAEISRMEKSIREMKDPTKTEFLRLIEGFKERVIQYGECEEIEIPECLRVERR